LTTNRVVFELRKCFRVAYLHPEQASPNPKPEKEVSIGSEIKKESERMLEF
jgi:hypothetical protein